MNMVFLHLEHDWGIPPISKLSTFSLVQCSCMLCSVLACCAVLLHVVQHCYMSLHVVQYCYILGSVVTWSAISLQVVTCAVLVDVMQCCYRLYSVVTFCAVLLHVVTGCAVLLFKLIIIVYYYYLYSVSYGSNPVLAGRTTLSSTGPAWFISWHVILLWLFSCCFLSILLPERHGLASKFT